MDSKEVLSRRVAVAAKRELADLVIKNAQVIDLYLARIIKADVAIVDGYIAALGQNYEGKENYDAKGQYLAPGFIDAHIHIESSYVSPEEFGRLVVPHGTTTIIADPHEIVNVAGVEAMKYMLEAADGTDLDIKYVFPSCVPATPFETSGAIIEAEDMAELMKDPRVLGLGEFMNYPGVVNADPKVINKLDLAHELDKIIDGHSPGVKGDDLNAYIATGIMTDHECSTVEEMLDRQSRGMYVQLRQGSACHDLAKLLQAVNENNERFCLLCSDDRQVETILTKGHLEEHLTLCVEHGLTAIQALRMASMNPAQCYRLYDRGAVAPGKRADLVLLDNLQNFKVNTVFIQGKKVGEEGKYLGKFSRCPITQLANSFNVKDYSKDRLKLKLKSNKVYTIDVLPGGVLSGKGTAEVARDDEDCFIYGSDKELAKLAVIERHTGSGNVALALLKNYGIKYGAVALSIAHDSHNIIAVGSNDLDMDLAIKSLIEQQGGIVLTKNNQVIESLALPIGGLMSDREAGWVQERLKALHKCAWKELEINSEVEPIMTLCFMSLAVIPSLKLTDMGLFDVEKFGFINLECEE